LQISCKISAKTHTRCGLLRIAESEWTKWIESPHVSQAEFLRHAAIDDNIPTDRQRRQCAFIKNKYSRIIGADTPPRVLAPMTTSTPAPPKKFLRLPLVKESTGLSRTSIYRQIAAREFPRPINIGLRSVAWVESEVLQWMEQREEQLSRDRDQAA
jgi:prophage regulatory protein